MPDTTLRARFREPRILVAAAVGALALLVIGYWFFSAGPGARILSPEGATVVEFTGVADAATASFTVRDGWRIRWSTSGESLTIAVRGERNFGTVVSVDEPDNGVTVPPAGGTYHLEVSAEGPWTIAILQGE